jgi:hypothetical protein
LRDTIQFSPLSTPARQISLGFYRCRKKVGLSRALAGPYGELMAEQAAIIGLAKAGNPNWVSKKPNSPASLDEAGIDNWLQGPQPLVAKLSLALSS